MGVLFLRSSIVEPPPDQEQALYVRPGATGDDDGSDWTNAFPSIPATLQRGYTYYLADGSYGSYAFNDAASSDQLITVKKATESDHGTSVGWDSAYGDGVAAFTSWSFTTDDWLVDGQTGGGPDAWNSGFGITVTSSTSILMTSGAGVDNITIRHVGFDSDRGSTFIAGFKNVNGFSNHTFSHCAFTEIFGPPFHIGDATNLTIEHCYVFDNKNTAEDHSEGISSIGTNTNVVIRWCLWDSIEGTAVFAGVNVGESVGWKIYGNIFSRSVTTLYYYWEDPGTNQNDLTDAFIANNTIINNGPSSQGGFTAQQGSGNAAYNNLFYDNDANQFGWQNITHNYSYASLNIRSEGGPFDKDAEILSGEANGQSGSDADPFEDYNAGVPIGADLTATTSSGFDTGGIEAGNDVDMFGTARGTGGVWSRGAIQAP